VEKGGKEWVLKRKLVWVLGAGVRHRISGVTSEGREKRTRAPPILVMSTCGCEGCIHVFVRSCIHTHELTHTSLYTCNRMYTYTLNANLRSSAIHNTRWRHVPISRKQREACVIFYTGFEMKFKGWNMCGTPLDERPGDAR
jgi:hypothetical protein